MKKRSEIEEKYKWDLSGYFKSDEDFKKEFDNLKLQTHKLDSFRGKLNNEKIILECLKKQEELELRFEVLYVYASLKTREDATNSFYQERLTQVSSIINDFNTSISFIEVEIKKLSNAELKRLQNNSNYPNFFKQIWRNKKHILSEKEEKILSMSGEMASGFSHNFDVFDDADLKFPFVKDKNGKKKELNHSVYMEYMQSADRTLRKNTFKALNGEYGKFNNFLASNYISNIKKDVFYSRVSKYKSCLDASIYLEEASRKVYDKLIKKVNDNVTVLAEYFEVKRKSQGLKDFYIYDQSAREKSINKKYSFEEAIEIIKKAVAPLGKEYVGLIDKAVKERWIDIYPNENKDSGAFSWGAYRKNPIVLTNFIGDTHSIFTLAHELGHSMHSYYSQKNNICDQSGYTIFVAEVASIVNEMLLLNYLAGNTKNDEEKIYYYDYFLSEFNGCVFRQAMLSEFEQFAYETFEKGEPISTKVLNDYYYKLNQKYAGKKVKLEEEVKYGWSRVPHFYRAFYVYKYALGMISALYIVDNIISKEPERYINFLKSGSRKPPIELLKDAGVDLNKDETYNKAFKSVTETIEKWDKILSKR
ncbi:MAG: oligoendopeptidase F [Clostridia bacterium]|nr:oligoendopeptidase F [Clostridia bacterium]